MRDPPCATDSNLRNLTDVVHWAREHEPEVEEMISNANRVIAAATSVQGIRVYIRALLREYTTRLVSYTPRRHNRAIRFACSSLPDSLGERVCKTPGKKGTRRLLPDTCGFRVEGARFDTLHDAGIAARLDPELRRGRHSKPRAQEEEDAGLHERPACEISARVNARSTARWCFNFFDPVACRQHYVPGTAHSSCAHRPCVWSSDLFGTESRAAFAGCQPSHTPSTSSPACVSICCSSLRSPCNRSRPI